MQEMNHASIVEHNLMSNRYHRFLLILAAYFLLSTLTLPIVSTLWISELPVLALVQIPKLLPANAIRKNIVMEYYKSAGTSRGSFSPDYLAARVPALTITYAIPLFIIGLITLIRYRADRRVVLLTLLVAALAAVDYFATLQFGAVRGAISLF